MVLYLQNVVTKKIGINKFLASIVILLITEYCNHEVHSFYKYNCLNIDPTYYFLVKTAYLTSFFCYKRKRNALNMYTH